jgi:hypothetical protein
MARPIDSKSKGFVNYFLERTRGLLKMINNEVDLSNLKKAVKIYEKLLHKALRLADPKDTGAVQRLATGLSALSKAHAVIQKQPVEVQSWREIEVL